MAPLRARIPLPGVVLAILLGLAAPVSAQGFDVAIVAAEDNAVWRVDVENTLRNSGRFNSVASFVAYSSNVGNGLLSGYDAVLVWSFDAFHDPVTQGNALADYLDSGGGVVIATYADTNHQTDRFLRGRWNSNGYHLIEPVAGVTNGNASLGTLHDPNHPILAGVGNLAAGTSGTRGSSTQLAAGARRVADWSDGLPLVVVSDVYPGRVDLNMLPVSGGALNGQWEVNTDGDVLIANALEYAANAASFDLTLPQAVAGDVLEVEMSRLRAGAQVVSVFSFTGDGPVSTPLGTIEVSQPWFQTPPFPAGPDGRLSYSVTLPLQAAGRTLYGQAVELPEGQNSGRLSNPVAQPIP